MTEDIIQSKFPNAIPLNFDTFYIDEYTPCRRLRIIKFSNILGYFKEFSTLSYDEKTKILKQIEQSCFNQAKKQLSELNQDFDINNPIFIKIYEYICGNLAYNMDPKSDIKSSYLINLILEKKCDLNKLGQMTSEEMCPEKTQEIRARIAQRSNIKHSIKISSMYRCSKCKRNECTLERRHTRGLDEATNYRATCVFCKHTWNI
jgi:DNA-directed RNA polymerase subunit M/transcription elongation factor TFIIS